MKRFFTLILACAFIFAALPAAAEEPDLSGLSFDQLVALRERLNLAIWSCQEWQEVTVPAGTWVIGVDIPAGHWTVRPLKNDYVSVTYCDAVDEYGTDPAPGWNGWNGCLTGSDTGITASEPHEISLEMKDGMFFICRHTVTFTPYTGKPDLGFQ